MSKKKHEEHEEHVNHEAWVIPYADMLTLLMCLFLIMWSTGQADKAKFAQVAANIRAEFGNAALDGSKGILDGLGPSPVDDTAKNGSSDVTPPTSEQLSAAVAALKAQNEIAGAVAREKSALSDAQAQISASLNAAGLGDSVQFSLEDRGLVVSILSDKVLFNSGAATLQPEADEVLQAVANSLRGLPNQLIIEGHTDSIPYTGALGSNWELSTVRATSVLRWLEQNGAIDTKRLSATGYADTRPVAPNENADGRNRNRRVEIVVVSTYASALNSPKAPSQIAAQTGSGNTITPAAE